MNTLADWQTYGLPLFAAVFAIVGLGALWLSSRRFDRRFGGVSTMDVSAGGSPTHFARFPLPAPPRNAA
ncbi:hypothetical protein OPKNFCMD_6661 [Methylobacterium crusticola]|uniref:Uncharacterized protein n=1 Tax=Methylobacterium crusticola TaxID=1697972 RepID=A0ABQ4R903_9HYPH|nr:hypothetical protein OPKNFCMD_6661 [Methylobacterium crusticola]